MIPPNIQIAAAFFGAGISFATGVATLLTVILLGANRRRVARHVQSQFDLGYMTCLADRAAAPVNFPLGELDHPDLNVRAMRRIAELEADGTAAKVRQEYAEAAEKARKAIPVVKDSPTAIMPKPVHVARHRIPTQSPLVGVSMSLAAGSNGWEVARVDPVTQTDLISLRAIREQGSAQS